MGTGIKLGLKRSRVLTALIGEAWLSVKDEHGELLLYKADDYVRYEIAKALGDGLKLIPVLFENAKMPHLSDLLPDLCELSRKQPIVISYRGAFNDVKVLIRAIKRNLKIDKSDLRNV